MRQGSKVADLSRQFSQAGLTCQGSTGSDGSRQDSKVSDLSRQGSASPVKQVPGSTDVPVASSLAPAISTAFARASRLAEPPASSSQAQQTSPQVAPAHSAASPDAADAAVPVEKPDSGVHPQGSLSGATSPRVLAAEGSVTQLAPAAETIATPAAAATSARIPLLQGTEEAAPQTHPDEAQPPLQHPVAALPLAEEHLRVRPISARAAPRTSGDSTAALPSPVSASSEPIQSTLSAVQKDYVQMIAEQEEERQAHAAEVAGLGGSSSAEYDSEVQTGPSNAQDPQSAFIPAASHMPHGPSKKGNNALFQMLAAGQTGTSSQTQCRQMIAFSSTY